MSSMWTSLLTVVVALTVTSASYLSPSGTSSMVLRRFTRSDSVENDQTVEHGSKVKMYEMHVLSRVQHRFANTLITSRVANNHNTSQQVSFSVVLPETAFISGFTMEVDGKVYKAYVKEKEEAKREYDQAVQSGLGAAHVAVSARDSNRFDVSVNVESRKKITFNLTYDELLTRRLGTYNLAINLDPGQVIRDFTVDVFITENRNITTLRVPELRSGNEVDADETSPASTLATVSRLSPTVAHVTFHPSPKEQKALGHRSSTSLNQGDKGLTGQFVVQYDIDRSAPGGDVLVDDGYFVHFFAPKDLLPLRKHVVFVLDVSGSMRGRKMAQLKEAMVAILSELNEEDYFNIIEFSSSVQALDLRQSPTDDSSEGDYHSYWRFRGQQNTSTDNIPAFPATPGYIATAKEYVDRMSAMGGTNIYDALKIGLDILRTAVPNANVSSDVTLDRTLIFLTDGDPTVGRTSLTDISSMVQELNGNPKCPLYSLAFGNDADLEFLKKLSLQNSGFARKIYEASDAALQLRNFYRQIASPLLANVTFTYKPNQIVEEKTTKTKFPSFQAGSEIVVAGKIRNDPENPKSNENFEAEILGTSQAGGARFNIMRPFLPDRVVLPHLTPTTETPPTPASSIERLWAYLTIQQLLEIEKAKSSTNNNTQTNPKQEALNLALQYAFVTPVTSLVVVKPNSSEETRVRPADQQPDSETHPSSHIPTYQGLYLQRPQNVPPPPPTLAFMPTAHRASAPRRRQQHSGHGLSTMSVGHGSSWSARSGGGQPLMLTPLQPRGDVAMISSADTQSGLTLINLTQLDWLAAVSNASHIQLPTGVFQLDLTHQVMVETNRWREHNGNYPLPVRRSCQEDIWNISVPCLFAGECSTIITFERLRIVAATTNLWEIRMVTLIGRIIWWFSVAFLHAVYTFRQVVDDEWMINEDE